MRGRLSLGFLSCAARRTRIFGGIASSPTGPGGVARTILIILIRIVIVIIIVIIIIVTTIIMTSPASSSLPRLFHIFLRLSSSLPQGGAGVGCGKIGPPLDRRTCRWIAQSAPWMKLAALMDPQAWTPNRMLLAIYVGPLT